VTLAIYKRGYLVIHRLSEHSVFFFLAAETSHVETFPKSNFIAEGPGDYVPYFEDERKYNVLAVELDSLSVFVIHQ